MLESHSTERGCYGPQGKTDGSSNDALKRCLASQLKENGGIGSISEQLLDTRADVTIGGGSKYFRQTVQGGECAGKTVLGAGQGNGLPDRRERSGRNRDDRQDRQDQPLKI